MRTVPENSHLTQCSFLVSQLPESEATLARPTLAIGTQDPIGFTKYLTQLESKVVEWVGFEPTKARGRQIYSLLSLTA